jgi:hypothetical protein
MPQVITLNSFDCIVRIILVLECVLLSFQSNCLLALTKKLSLEDAMLCEERLPWQIRIILRTSSQKLTNKQKFEKDLVFLPSFPQRNKFKK